MRLLSKKVGVAFVIRQFVEAIEMVWTCEKRRSCEAARNFNYGLAQSGGKNYVEEADDECLLRKLRFLSLFIIMEGEASWFSHCPDDTVEPDSFSSELKYEDEKQVSSVLVDLILPDDLLERILARLPIASIFRAGCVCKRWHEIVKSGRFLWNSSRLLSHKPWYFMFTSSEKPIGYAYDPTFRKWYVIELPCIWTSSCFISSSCGLFCFMDNSRTDQLYVCNPITKCCKNLEEPPGFNFSDYNALAMVVDRKTRCYSVTIVKSKRIPENFFQCDVSIDIYDSGTTMWMTCLTDVLTGWRGGDESVICDGVLYIMIYSTGIGGSENHHGLITYNLSSRSCTMLMSRFIPGPCCLYVWSSNEPQRKVSNGRRDREARLS
ncbi:hypothetical protein H5410_028520 [Solanum commersonii]|uniref:F-box domain-containing protein n=1 Tax=Solanum commersonii TaxID=4109 RepID=A0A9J5Z6D6_SOLCO|nr:hypothetical protein H5410_028520 [Solanum commersonii]